MEDDVIYCSEGSISKDALANANFADEFQELGIKLVEYDGSPPLMLESDQFATEATYEKIMAVDRERICPSFLFQYLDRRFLFMNYGAGKFAPVSYSNEKYCFFNKNTA